MAVSREYQEDTPEMPPFDANMKETTQEITLLFNQLHHPHRLIDQSP